jgi:ubiquinone/menaquinone biosynthesis C-methylase UbiE
VDHGDHVRLLKDGIPGAGGVWADFGSGTGAFTLALADLIGSSGRIYSIDKDETALREQKRAMRARFPAVGVHYIVADFTRPLVLPPLDGVVMANALHFVRNKDAVLAVVSEYLRPGGRFVLVEYNADRGNIWVPYPLPYTAWEKLSNRNGLARTRLLATIPSRFLDEIYSAVSWRQPS